MCLRATHTAKTQSHCSQMLSEGPIHTGVPTHHLKPVPPALQNSCGLVLPHMHTHTHTCTHRASRDTNCQPDQPECLSIRGAAAAHVQLQTLRAAVPYVPPWTLSTMFPPTNLQCRAQKLCNIWTPTLSQDKLLQGSSSRSLM